MASLSLRGPEKLGAGDLDEGRLTEAVCDSYGSTDGKSGQRAAEAILPLRRALWRLAEEFCKPELAAALRERLAVRDPSGRAGIRELRAAVADWLVPPPRCRRCGRALSPSMSGADRPVCPNATSRVYAGRGVHPRPVQCVAPRGRPRLYPVASVPPDRCGTFSMFGPLDLGDFDVTRCMRAAVAQAKPGKAPRLYDIACDRDGRSLLAATAPTTRGGQHPAVRLARARLDHALNIAIRENGRLILATQRKMFTAAGGVCRADLVQAGAMGCRRALMDYDTGRELRCTFTTYAVSWIHQSMGEAFGEHDLVAPAWVKTLRTKLTNAGIDPWELSAAIDHVADTRRLRPVDTTLPGKRQALLRSAGIAGRRNAAEGLVLLLLRALVDAPTLPRRGTTPPPKFGLLAHASGTSAVRSLLAEAADPVRQWKTGDGGEEKARERVAEWCAEAVGVRATGQAVLAALRAGAGVTTTDELANPGESDREEDEVAGRNANRRTHADYRGASMTSASLDGEPDTEDGESSAEAEQDARERWAQVHRALESLRDIDPEAAEVVRRRTGIDGARDGAVDGETLDAICSSPLRSTGRLQCRESVRKAYERGRAYLSDTCAS